MPYDGGATRASELVARGGGSLVASIYSDDERWIGELVPHAGAWNGRLYLGSKKMAEQALGSGLALAPSKHGGPGRAGGGEELGGARGLHLYMQRVALQGSRATIERLCGKGEPEQEV
jgi:oxepin-CoA hydrolase/3-oxo-5,6-dehydrosuberyl-CoA semialdehyde dehydrogenase